MFIRFVDDLMILKTCGWYSIVKIYVESLIFLEDLWLIFYLESLEKCFFL